MWSSMYFEPTITSEELLHASYVQNFRNHLGGGGPGGALGAPVLAVQTFPNGTTT
jgi:hypothetical protein